MAFSDIHTRNVLSQCTFWCSVLSDRNTDMNPEDRDLSQCTFWRSVLSDNETPEIFAYRLNVSQCTFWCSVLCDWTLTLTWTDHDWVSMHLLVLSAFRRYFGKNNKKLGLACLNAPSGAQCFPTA